MNVGSCPGGLMLKMVPSILLKSPNNSTLIPRCASMWKTVATDWKLVNPSKQHACIFCLRDIRWPGLMGWVRADRSYLYPAHCSHLRCWKWQIQHQKSSCRVASVDGRARTPQHRSPRGGWGLTSCLASDRHRAVVPPITAWATGLHWQDRGVFWVRAIGTANPPGPSGRLNWWGRRPGPGGVHLTGPPPALRDASPPPVCRSRPSPESQNSLGCSPPAGRRKQKTWVKVCEWPPTLATFYEHSLTVCHFPSLSLVPPATVT